MLFFSIPVFCPLGFLLYFFLDKKVPKNQGCLEIWINSIPRYIAFCELVTRQLAGSSDTAKCGHLAADEFITKFLEGRI
jgi:hypothetical protein